MYGKVVFILLLNLYSIKSLEDSKYWRVSGMNEIKDSLSYKWNQNTAKNVILFIGDGMSVDTITASRINYRGETSYLAWEKFPHVGLLKTYNTNKQVPDSASTATALFSGVKTNYKVVGVDINVQLGNCEASLNEKYHLQSIIDWAQEAGKDTGFVTTTRVTHATPAPLYAHSANRMWECEDMIPENSRKCKDIARQLVEDLPGRNIKVIMGGGRQELQSNASARESDPIDNWACYRKDGMDLMSDWAKDKKEKKSSYKIVENTEQLRNIKPESLDYLLGIFANGHMNMDFKRQKDSGGQPSLEEMTTMAIKVLRKSTNGYLLVVEGGLIDFAHHRGHAAQALEETARFSDAINATLDLIDTQDTLVIVTSDHSHSMSFNGYAERGSSVLGIAANSKIDGIPFTTLTYSTGGPNNMAYEISADNKTTRIDPSKANTFDFTYSQQAAIITNEALHGGGDIPVYAIGPFAHLLHSTHEQNYVAHVIGYASKIGPYANGTTTTDNKWNMIIISLVCLIFFTKSIFSRD